MQPVSSGSEPRSSLQPMAAGLRRWAALLVIAGAGAATGAVTPAAVAAQSPCGAFHTVDTGDTLGEIAARCGVTLPALLAANPGVVDHRDLERGDRLRIPDPAAAQPGPQEACGPSYRVRTGDTLAEIAAKCGLTIPLLLAANPPLPDPLGVQAGLEIVIPPLPYVAVRDTATFAVSRTTSAADTTAAPDPGGAPDSTTALRTSPETSRDTASPPERPPLIEVTGILREGERCPLVVEDDGTTTGILGDYSVRFRFGDRVTLLGVRAGSPDRCGADKVVDLRIMYRSTR